MRVACSSHASTDGRALDDFLQHELDGWRAPVPAEIEAARARS
jgi:hypothetical protein